MVNSSIIDDGPAIESSHSAISWGAVFAGAIVASALSLVLLALGSGIGLVSISPWSNSGVSATTFGVLAVAWFIAIQLFSSGVGGYIAGRLRTRWVEVHTDEVFFRDTAHGFLVWAVGSLLSAVLLAGALSSAISGVAHVTGAVAQGAASAASSVAAFVAPQDTSSYFTDMLFRSDKPATQADESATRTEVGRVFAKALADGNWSPADQTYVAQVVSRETGIPQADAEKRVTDVLNQAKAAAQQAADTAKKAADAARKLGIYASLWAFISLLVGAFSASFMAT
ncbi:MAG: hypothetical protein KGI75_29310, partial [Rhizobiaceae bacterium]|nr:hypothetical protein [Rhizobiaceae bacterium]